MKKIDISKWKEFAVGDLFPRIVKPPVFHVRETDECSDGVEYVVRSKFNNGVKYIVKRPATETNPIGTISFGAENAAFFYRTKDWISGRDIYYIDSRHLTENACLFIISCLQKIAAKYPYNFGLFPKLLVKETIKLPITSEGLPDYAYMDKTVARLKRRVRKSLKSKQEEIGNAVAAKHKMDISHWRDFPISQLFDIVKGTRLTKKDMREGSIRFVGASAVNNGITAHISNDTDLHPADTITVNYNGSVGASFYQDEPFWASDDVNVLYPKFPLNRDIAMFLIPIITKVGQNHEFTDKWKKEDMEKDTIKLPATSDGSPDFAYMESLIRELSSKTSEHLDLLKGLASN